MSQNLLGLLVSPFQKKMFGQDFEHYLSDTKHEPPTNQPPATSGVSVSDTPRVSQHIGSPKVDLNKDSCNQKGFCW